MQIDRNVNGDGPDRQAAPQNINLLPENLFQGTAGVALDGKCGAAQESRCGEFAPYFNDRERSLARGVSGEVNPKSDYRRQGQKDHRISAAQRLFGDRDPFRLHAADIFRGALELDQNLVEDRLRLVLPAGLVEQEAVT